MRRSTFLALTAVVGVPMHVAPISAETLDSASHTIALPTAFVDGDYDGIDDNVAVRHTGGSRTVRDMCTARRRHMFDALWDSLRPDVRVAVEQFAAAMDDEGQPADTIHAEVGRMLTDFGLALPAGWHDTPADFALRQHLRAALGPEVQALVRALHEAGGTAYEIREAVAARYGTWGAVGDLGGRPPPTWRPPEQYTGCTTCGSSPSDQMYEGR